MGVILVTLTNCSTFLTYLANMRWESQKSSFLTSGTLLGKNMRKVQAFAGGRSVQEHVICARRVVIRWWRVVWRMEQQLVLALSCARAVRLDWRSSIHRLCFFESVYNT